MKMNKKLISLIMSLAMCCSITSAFASQTNYPIVEGEVYLTDGELDVSTLSVEVEGIKLVKDVDYELTYENNIKVGTATIIITFKGNYTGQLTKNFEIVKASTGGGGGGGGGGSSTSTSVNVTVTDNKGNKVNVTKKQETDKVIITLPTNREINDEEQYTIIVKDTKGNVKEDYTVVLKDKNGKDAEGKTDAEGKVVLPQITPIPSSTPSPTPEVTENNHNSYISGYGNGLFMPDKKITRAETASMLNRLLIVTEQNEPLTFSDLIEGAWYVDAVDNMSSAGIINGYTDGTFRPDNNITRAEFVTMIMQNDTVSKFVNVPFTDVNKDLWSADFIYSAYKAGYISGYEDGTFRPDAPITRAEAVTILNKALGRDTIDVSELKNPFTDVNESHWAYEQILEAAVNHMHKLQLN